MTGRFAPSPTGRMHLGNAFCALLSWLSAKSQGGEWRLRIEDLDPQRSRKEYAEQLMDDLRWLGLTWDGEVLWQSSRANIYNMYLERLCAKGLTYPCYCSRADIMATQAPHESDGRVAYKGTCRNLTEAQRAQQTRQPATRVIVPNTIMSFCDGHYGKQGVSMAEQCGDFIVQRGDGAFAYQLAVVVDDGLSGITEVVRGRDLLLSSPQQLYLYEQLGLPAPTFTHHPLICNTDGQRLSKRDKSFDMGEIRKYHTAEEVIGYLAYLADIQKTPTPCKVQELISEFSWEKVPHDDIVIANEF